MQAEYSGTIEQGGVQKGIFLLESGERIYYPIAHLVPEDQTFIKELSSKQSTSSASSSQTGESSASIRYSSAFEKSFGGKLVALNGHKLNRGQLPKNVEYYAFYFSAHWCPPCRKFTPKLVDFYDKNKSDEQNFEIIFVSADRSAKDMLEYMRWGKMGFPALNYGEKVPSVYALPGNSIPCLVVTDATGKVLKHSDKDGRNDTLKFLASKAK